MSSSAADRGQSKHPNLSTLTFLHFSEKDVGFQFPFLDLAALFRNANDFLNQNIYIVHLIHIKTQVGVFKRVLDLTWSGLGTWNLSMSFVFRRFLKECII